MSLVGVPLSWAIGGALALSAVTGGVTYWQGNARGKATVNAEWQKERDDLAAKREEDAEFAQNLGFSFEATLTDIEKRYARTPIAAANRLPVICPKSGLIGDVVLPAALLDSMFNREATATGTEASPGEPADAVR